MLLSPTPPPFIQEQQASGEEQRQARIGEGGGNLNLNLGGGGGGDGTLVCDKSLPEVASSSDEGDIGDGSGAEPASGSPLSMSATAITTPPPSHALTKEQVEKLDVEAEELVEKRMDESV
jgi:hypothetical protein